MKHLRKTLSMFLVLCMLITSMGTSVFAEEFNEDQISTQDSTVEAPIDSVIDNPEAVVPEEGILASDETPDIDEPAAEEAEENIADAAMPATMALNDDGIALAAEMSTITKNQSVALDTSKIYKVFHLDNGRKYFSVDQIKAIIDTMGANDYNYLELAIGNDGLRFLLDDMSVTVNGTTYTSANVTAGIKAGNKAYCDCGTNELTQSEMDEIITYANAKGVSIIPLVNTPGHMDAILTCMKQIGISNPNYSTSVRTVDITNGTAADFTLALVNKYILYFAGKGCKIFNMGADEYANDIQSQPQFAGLISSRKYGSFVNYVNNMAAQIQNAGMVPMAFNDGIYYNQNTSYGTFDQNIVISYWSSGWSGYNVAPASFLYNKGHKILNTNGNWYYVLNAANGTSWDTAKSNLQSTPYDSVQGSTVPVVGAMVCYWCDTPSYSYSSTEQQHVQDMITTFAAANPTVFDLNKETPETTPEPENPGTETPDADKTETINLKVGESTTKNITGANYAGTYTAEPAGIASVTVTGKDKVEASTTTTYTSTPVRRSTLTNSKTSWTKTNYFYKFGDNYYPVYAYQKKNYGITTYYYGYSTTDRATNVTQIDSSISGTGTWDVYEAKTTTVPATDASTTITFNGDKAGTTYVTIGDTKYTINVTKKTQPVSVTVGGSETYTDTTASTAKSANTSIATVSSNGTRLTINGVAVGSTTVETDTTIYTVTVAAEDLSKVADATIELWITNQRITVNNSNTVAVKATNAYSENGIAVKDIVPATGKSANSDNNVLWKVTALDKTSHEQTTSAGDNESLNGTDFNYIRYYNKKWSYSVDGKTWIDVTSNTQLVAYYLQRTTVTDEVTTDVVDYGVVPHTGYNSSNFVILDYSVKYESGEEVPSKFPVSGKTMGFHCDPGDKNTVHQYNGGSSSTWSNNYRDIAMIRGVETADYEVYMITVTATTDNRGYQLASNCNAATNYSYTGTEYVAWAATQADIDNSGLAQYSSISGKYKCTVGGDPVVNGLEIFNRHGMKVTYYVRAKVTEDALTVNYVNQTTGEYFYNYNIAVQSGTVFNTGIALASPWKANLKNGSVTNILGKTQTVSADLSTMPAIGVSYRYSDYTCTRVERSADGKTVTLYYTFNNEHSFVADFGLPLKISTTDLGISGDWTNATVTNAKYGAATAVKGQGVTYTPNTTFKGIEQLSLNLSNGTDTTTQIIYIYPATTVYYEEGFAAYTGSWSAGTKGNGTQTTSPAKTTKATTAAVYGNDAKYASENAGASNGTEAATTAKGATAEFEFKGTGVDIYTNNTTVSGNLTIKITRGESIVKFATVRTKMANGEVLATTGQNVNAYSVPVYTITGLADATYTVKITHSDDAPVSIDGFRVHGTLAANDPVYVNDLEDNPNYIELRNTLLKAYNVDATGTKTQVYNANESAAETTVALLTDGTTATAAMAADILANGPKNELYLLPNQSVKFNVATSRQVQLGMKSVNAATTFTLNGTSKSISSSTDMFYTVNSGNIIIANKGNGILSITKIKVCDEPVVLAPLSDEDIQSAINALYVTPVEYADATVNVKLADYTGKTVASTAITVNGVVGETATVAAADIRAAAQAVLPAGYGIVDVTADVAVAFGESADVTVKAGKVATLNITYKKGSKKVGTATLTAVQTSKTTSYTFSTSEIKAAGPAGYTVISIAGTSVKFGSSKSLNATCL